SDLHAVRRMRVLRDAVELEPLDAVVLDQIAGLARPILALVRIDAGEGHADVVVLRRLLGDLVIADALCAHAALAIDSEQHQRDLRLAVEFDDLGHFGPLARGLEIGAGGIEELAHDRIFRIVAGDLRVNVDVDGADFRKIDWQGGSPEMQRPASAWWEAGLRSSVG